MAKLNKAQKAYFAQVFTSLEVQGNYAFLFDRENGISAMAVFTGNMKKHVRFVVAHCGENDTFKKKIGFTECAEKLAKGEGVVLPAEYDDLDENLDDFLQATFGYGYEWETI